MASKKAPSIYDLLRAKLVFTDEPLWFRLFVIAITTAILFGLIWALQKWAIPTLLLNKLTGIKWPEWLKLGKSRSP